MVNAVRRCVEGSAAYVHGSGLGVRLAFAEKLHHSAKKVGGAVRPSTEGGGGRAARRLTGTEPLPPGERTGFLSERGP